MTIFDGTDRPALYFMIEGDGIEETFGSTDLIELSLFRGRQKRNQVLQPATLHVALDNSAGTYDFLTAGSQISFKVFFTQTGYDDAQIWGGLLYSVHQYRGVTPTTVIESRDVLSYLDKQVLPGTYLNSYGSESVNTRATRIMTDYSWSSGLENGGIGSDVGLISTFGNTTALDALRQCAAAAGGSFYTRSDGSVFLADPAEKLTRTTMLAFTDDETADTVPFMSSVMSPASEQIVNSVTVARPSRVTASGLATTATYLAATRGIRWEAPVRDDITAEALAVYLARVDATPTESVAEIEFSGVDFLRNASTLIYNDLAYAEIGDVVTVKRLGSTYTCFIEGIKHSATSRDWRVRYYLSAWNDYSVDLVNGLEYAPASGTFVYETPADWTIDATTDTVRPATSLDLKWHDFSDRGSATGTLELYANAKQHIVYDSNSTGAFQFDCKGGSATSMSNTMEVGQCVMFDVLIKCNDTAHKANPTVLIDGISTHVTTIWLGGAPASGNAGGWDRYQLKVYMVNGEGTYRVVAERTASA